MGRGLAWTTDQFATLVRMRASGADYREIAAAVGRSVESCKNKLTHPSRHPDGAADLELAELRRVSNIDCQLWSTDAEAELIRLREVDGLSWYLLDSHFGRGHGSCRHKYRELAKIGRPKADKPELPPSPIITPRWTDADMTLAQTRWRELFVDVYGVSAPRHERFLIFEQIGRELQRSGPAVENRLRIHGASFGLSAASKPLALPVEISQAMVEREARKRAEAHRSITASFFGDPPPGYSALDQRRQQCTGAPRDI
jgi:hypothetical protein